MTAPSYATLALLKQSIPDVGWQAAYDTAGTHLLEIASRKIDAYVRRKPGAFAVSEDVERFFTGMGDGDLWIGELATEPTSVEVSEDGTRTLTVWASTDYICAPYNATDDGIPYTRLELDPNGTKTTWYNYPKGIKITGKFGFATTAPLEIEEATIIQAVRWFKRGQQAWADAGAIEALAQLRYVGKLDPDVQDILELPKFNSTPI